MAIVGSVTLDKTLNPAFMRDVRGFIGGATEAADLFKEDQCRSLLQEAQLTAGDLDRGKPMFDADRGLFKEFFSSRAKFLGFTAAALIKRDGTIVEQADVGDRAPRPDRQTAAGRFRRRRQERAAVPDSQRGPQLCRPAAAAGFFRRVPLRQPAHQSVHHRVPQAGQGPGRPVRRVRGAPPQSAAHLRHHVRPARRHPAAVGGLARPRLHKPPRRADPPPDRRDRPGDRQAISTCRCRCARRRATSPISAKPSTR